MYEPLQKELTIKKSMIHGHGIFSVMDILPDTKLGLTHLSHEGMLIRTPLGGFYNHSDYPNCEKYRVGLGYFLRSIRKIKNGEEITVKYTLYNIGD